MSRRNRQIVTLLAAVVTTGLTAGVFGDWAHTIMPGLATTDDRTFVGAFQGLDRAIQGPLFMLVFTGALLFTGAAAILHLRENRSVLPWVAVAFGLYLAAFVITMTVHEPLNAIIRNAGDPTRIADPTAVRDAFHEARWVAWHLVRTIATTVAFGCLAWALVLHGRATAGAAIRDTTRARTGLTH
ncbi:anthrone oxygenase family protein [Pseudonocardia sp. DLS-67]